MEKQWLVERAAAFIGESAENILPPGTPGYEELAGMQIYQPPLMGVAAAGDPLFERLREAQAIGPHHWLPSDWLLGAKSVVSFFLPFTALVKESNRRDMKLPSREWLYGRIEGQVVVNSMCRYLSGLLREAGAQAVAPSLDSRFWSRSDKDPEHQFTSNWSERHVAFVSGLGTFGLSRGLITEKGIAGRIGSVVTDLELAPDKRAYEGIYEYCTMCGACARNCPVNAITIEHGKDHRLCSPFVDYTKALYNPRYGCGKCQVAVPCMDGIPAHVPHLAASGV